MILLVLSSRTVLNLWQKRAMQPIKSQYETSNNQAIDNTQMYMTKIPPNTKCKVKKWSQLKKDDNSFYRPSPNVHRWLIGSVKKSPLSEKGNSLRRFATWNSSSQNFKKIWKITRVLFCRFDFIDADLYFSFIQKSSIK